MMSQNFEQLQNALNNVRLTLFPASSSNTAINDIRIELIEYDGYIAGIATHILKTRERGNHVPYKASDIRTTLENARSKFPSDVSEVDMLIRYLDVVEELAEKCGDVVRTISPPEDALQ